MRIKEYHTKSQSQQPKSEVDGPSPWVVLHRQRVRLRDLFKALQGDAIAGDHGQLVSRGGQLVGLFRRQAARLRRLRDGDFALAVRALDAHLDCRVVVIARGGVGPPRFDSEIGIEIFVADAANAFVIRICARFGCSLDRALESKTMKALFDLPGTSSIWPPTP